MTYAEQLKSPKWQRKRLEIFERDNFTCKLCGNTEDTLHVHHKEYINGKKCWEYENSYLDTLCVHCHDVIEYLKPSGIIVESIYLLTFKDGKKSHLVCKSTTKFCVIWEFKINGDVNGKELVLILPYPVMEDIFNFLKEPVPNGN